MRVTAERPRPGSTTDRLLPELLRDTLEPAYAEAAARRSAGAPSAGSGRGRTAVVAALALLGLLLGTAYVDARDAAPASERTRQSLLEDVRRDSARSADLRARLAALRAEVSEAVDAELRATQVGRDRREAVATLETVIGLVAVDGPGVIVTVSDAAPVETVDPVTGDPVTAVPEAGVVLDLDLQAVVNALWAAGAEAIAVNGQRLASRTSIRTAGEAVLVDFQPVLNPYVVRAIGDPARLLPRFAGSQTAARYEAYQQLYGIGFTLVAQETLSVPAASDTDLRYAVAVEPPPPVGTTK